MPNFRRPTSDLLRFNSGAPNHIIKQRLFAEGWKRRQCERCGISTWCGDPAPLELDHIDGNPENNEIENLHILCSNCHAQKTKRTRRDSAIERRLTVPERLYEDDLE